MQIGSLQVDPPLFLAPMAGVTDRDFRLIVRRMGGVGMVAMEFLSARGLVRGERRWQRLTHFVAEERPLAIQIYGNDAATMAQAAEVVAELGPDVCDINMGCPANKVLKGCAGAALMNDLSLARDIVRQVRQRLALPLTVKFRLGRDDASHRYLELGRICQGEGADAVTLHPRTARQMFCGEADWSAIARLKEALDIPVLGNGDVRTAADAVAMLRSTGCDGVMIGRGATRNPWIFSQAAALLAGRSHRGPSLEARHRLIREHFLTVVGRDPRPLALHKLRTFTGVYSHGLAGGQRLRRRIQELSTPQQFLDAIDEFFTTLGEGTEEAEAAA